ncbi:Ubiquitin carboxyl-terminal hydrolase [Actinidia chinensis var. chinensis]|uniref:ubiquitinyl hydrolase 1 n=1 Tax=Actinidia chinensis var. chinensis TaxID=1590841 RepID=A0A2R6PYG8_ACTCC|nr:Ubiquitin carboxyl-terminal hydrolase [Actinidia chinensis var. chinensis]
MTLMTPPPLEQEDDEMLVPHSDFGPEPQPMEVEPAETTNTVDAQAVDDPPSARFTWTIENFSRLNTKKLYSDVFYVGGYKWRVLIFPKGNNVDHLSMYLDVADSPTLPYGWSRYAQFSLSVVNQIHNKYTTRKETTNTVDAQAVDDPPSARFTWTIENFSRLNTKKLYSDVFYVGGYKWRVLIFPKGNNVDHLSMYLDVADSPTLPYGWSRYAQFSLSVVNQIHNKYTTRKDTQHQFNARESDWGFTSFMPLGELYDPGRGYLVNDTIVVEADVAINDRYEFPLQLDLDRENGKYLSPEADRSVRNLYTLHSVLVHSGGVHGGHYYAYIRPTLSDKWFKFDDERVTKEDMKRALEEQYGGEEELPQTNPGFNNSPFKFTKYSNAYMLVYIRESDKEKIICNVDEKDIAEHLRIRLKKEQEEKEQKRKEKAEAHLYTIIKVARDEDLLEQIGRDIYFDLVDHDKVRIFRIQKQMPFSFFKEEVAKELGIPVQFQRFWLWAKRQNHTYRPNRPLTPQEEAQSVGQLREVSNKANIAELKLFLEVELGQDLRPIPPPVKSKEEILLFFKLYDPLKEELRYVGRLFVKANGKPGEILTKLNEMSGFGPEEEIELFEEIKFEPKVMCEHIDKKLTFRGSQLEDGDIICFQKLQQVGSSEQRRYPDVPSFLEYVHNRQVVRFRSLEKPKEDEFFLELSKLHNYDDVVERVARHLGLDDPSKMRLTSHNCYSQQPKPQPIKYRGVDHLSDMLVHYNQTSDILYYEVLDIPLPELQGLKTLKVTFHHATKEEVVIHTIRLPKQSTVGDVINDLKTKVELSHPDAELRLLEVFYHKIYKIFPLNEKIENINDQYWTLRAEEIPEEEKNLGPHDRLIHIYHFMKDTAQTQVQVQNFGEPFFLVIHEGEMLTEVKVRIQKKLQVPDEEFSKWKFAFLSLGRPEYLQDSDIVSSRFQRRDVYGAWEQYLGLEHSDNAPKRSSAANQNRHTFEKPVRIYN